MDGNWAEFKHQKKQAQNFFSVSFILILIFLQLINNLLLILGNMEKNLEMLLVSLFQKDKKKF